MVVGQIYFHQPSTLETAAGSGQCLSPSGPEGTKATKLQLWKMDLLAFHDLLDRHVQWK